MLNCRPIPVLLLVVGIATTNQDAQAAIAAGATKSPTLEGNIDSVEQLSAKAAEAFRAGHIEEALDKYRLAIGIAKRSPDEARLRMNAGACLVELKRFEQAKAEFVKVAELEPALAQKARLNAAFVAIELDQVAEAQELLYAASPVENALLSRVIDLKERIVGKLRLSQRRALLVQMSTAANAITRNDFAAAESALLAAQQQFDSAEPSERVDVLHSLGTVQLALDKPRDAKRILTSAVDLAPKDPELHYGLARAHEALGETEEARAEFKKALALGLKKPVARAAKEHLAAVDRLGASEWFGWMVVAGGYDSNARQSGAATETTLGRRGRGGSAYGRIAAELGRTERLSEQFSMRVRYSGEWLGLQKRLVRELSLQTHSLFGSTQWAPTDRLVLGLEFGPSLTYIGMSPVSPFTREVLAAAKARYRASNVRSFRLSLELRKVAGLSGWEFLGGSRFDGELSHSWSYRSDNFRLGIRGRYLAIGTRRTTVDATVIPACTTICEGAEYVIPLSYFGFGPTASARVELASTLHLVGTAQLDWRRYRDESYIAGIAPSRKRRHDLRWSGGIDLQWALDEDKHVLIVPSYAILVSSSNVALSSTDPAHTFDYDDRSFTQHFAELGVELSF